MRVIMYTGDHCIGLCLKSGAIHVTRPFEGADREGGKNRNVMLVALADPKPRTARPESGGAQRGGNPSSSSRCFLYQGNPHCALSDATAHFRQHASMD